MAILGVVRTLRTCDPKGPPTRLAIDQFPTDWLGDRVKFFVAPKSGCFSVCVCVCAWVCVCGCVGGCVGACVCVFFFDAPKLFWWIQVRARHVGHFRQSRVLVHLLFCATNTLSWAILALQCQQNKTSSIAKSDGQKCQLETTKSLHSASGVSTTRHSQWSNGIWCKLKKESDATELKRTSTVTEIE